MLSAVHLEVMRDLMRHENEDSPLIRDRQTGTQIGPKITLRRDMQGEHKLAEHLLLWTLSQCCVLLAV